MQLFLKIYRKIHNLFGSNRKSGEVIPKTISYRLQFIDSARFMTSSLSNPVDYLSEGIHKTKCTDCNKCCLKYANFKDGLVEFNIY